MIFTLQAAHAQYSAELLTPFTPNYPASVYGTGSGERVGAALGAGRFHAALWNGARNSIVDLDPGLYGSVATSVDGGLQAGYYGVRFTAVRYSSHTYYHAILWFGKETGFIDLHPAGDSIYGESRVYAMALGHQYGVCDGSAAIWGGTASSLVKINPAWAISSQILASDGVQQVGTGSLSTTSWTEAILWRGSSASAVNLDPSGGLEFSGALGVDSVHNQQVGYIGVLQGGLVPYHAAIWSGTAASVVDIHPAGYIQSQATATRSGTQVGFATTGVNQQHAMVWHGSSASAVNLEQYLPTGVSSSIATAIDVDGSIVGSALIYGIQYPVVWHPTATGYVQVSQTPANNGQAWINKPVTFDLKSPFTAPTSTISYQANGGAVVTTAGSKASFADSQQGTTVYTYWSTDGLRHYTPRMNIVVTVDTVPPSTSLAYASNAFTLSAVDAGSGVATTYYQLDGGGTTKYTAPVAVTNVSHTVVYWSVDKAGNVEPTHTQVLQPVAPTLTSVVPNRVFSNPASDVTITLAGTEFEPQSQVTVNGVPVQTAFVNLTQLSVVIPASLLSGAGAYEIQVKNPNPGTGSSAQVPLNVYVEADATGAAGNVVGTNLQLSPVTSYKGFTLTNGTVNVNTNANTTYLDATGAVMTQFLFFDTLQDGQSVSVVGSYANGTLTAWTIQMH